MLREWRTHFHILRPSWRVWCARAIVQMRAPTSSRRYNKLASLSPSRSDSIRSLSKLPGSIQLATAVKEATRRDERDNSAVLETIIDYWTRCTGRPEVAFSGVVRELRPFGRPRVYAYIAKVTKRLVTSTTTRHAGTEAEQGAGMLLRSTALSAISFRFAF